MKILNLKQFLAVSFLASLVAVSALFAWTATASADSSVQWAGGNATEHGIVPSRDLRWSKPKVAETAKNSPVITTAEASLTEPKRIQQVQYKVAQATPATPPMTPAQRDTVFPELRPKSNTPPTGATLVPTVPTAPAKPVTPPPAPQVPKTQPKQEATSSVPAATAPSKPATKPAEPTVKPKTDAAALPKPEPKAVELKTPDLKSDLPESRTGIGAAPAPDALDNIAAPKRGTITCPDDAGFKSIREISYDIRPMPGTLPTECPLKTTPYNGRHFSRTCFQWKASALCTKGAYFEDVQLERYGHSICPVLEPVISGARFFLTVPILPYKMGLTPPNECVYTLGHYRVGSCSPYMLDPLPLSIRAALFEGAAIGGAIAIIP